MSRRAPVWTLWLVVGGLMAAVAVPLGGPLLRAWACYRLAASGELVQAEVKAAHPESGLALQVLSGSAAGTVCSVRATAEPGDLLDVYVVPDRPDHCELQSTVEASGALLWVLSSVTVSLLLGMLLVGRIIHRSFTATPELTSRLDLALDCPRCGKPMSEGYLPLVAGLHWRAVGEPTGLPHALRGLPGTVGWRGRPRLHAFRCEPCEVITLRYGRPGPR